LQEDLIMFKALSSGTWSLLTIALFCLFCDVSPAQSLRDRLRGAEKEKGGDKPDLSEPNPNPQEEPGTLPRGLFRANRAADRKKTRRNQSGGQSGEPAWGHFGK
jgi:hypothetical protein